ncbi:MAG: YlmC/YmxH family sporulation protein [Eubacteriales bacterium]|nr:YlmC/YmxH family sporulation protein [Eubacteriales bacterium]MDD3199905.1 YlmC/YmxH family sporulation protein [Eubacteriales bacterium]MDD4121534.1 YlmC/YmxH family sporulation protein [Eubacteriales bacterium]MDD4630414.1 YlmC/YmxH family sporulation protein [Eubacteriales bacterium]
MRLSDLGDKEIVNLANGSRHGQLADAELLFDEQKGVIKAILLPDISGRFNFWGNKDYLQLPWNAIRKIGEDIIIFDVPEL